MSCSKCGQQHLTRHNTPACTGHRKSHLDQSTGQRIFYPEAERPACTKSPMRGQDVCGSHGGRASQNKAAGEAREAERRAAAAARRWGVPIEISGTDAMITQVHVWAGLERFYREKVETLRAKSGDSALIWGRTKHKTGGEDRGTTKEAKPNAWLVLHEQAARNLVKFAAEAIKAGIEERKVRLAEQQGALVADVIKRILADLNLSHEQTALVGEIVPRHLRLLTG